MFPYPVALLCALLQLSSVFPASAAPALAPRYYPQGTISAPANGTNILPGAPFAFLYNPRGDYCLSGFNFTVWLLTSPPAGIAAGDATGHYFGRFAYESFSNMYPTNPPPAQLTMPDFSQSPGGFGAGEGASGLTMYLAVIEEWNSCEPTIGNHFSLAANNITYNGTETS